MALIESRSRGTMDYYRSLLLLVLHIRPKLYKFASGSV